MAKAEIVVFGKDLKKEVKRSGMLQLFRDLGIDFKFSVVSLTDYLEDIRKYCLDSEADIIIGFAIDCQYAKAIRPEIPIIYVPVAGAESPEWDCTYGARPGLPVIIVGIGKKGLWNAGWCAAEILALKDEDILDKLRHFREKRN